jgi:hypothetical protein
MVPMNCNQIRLQLPVTSHQKVDPGERVAEIGQPSDKLLAIQCPPESKPING